MKKSKNHFPEENLLRKNAEERLRQLQKNPDRDLTEADAKKLLHELQVHQIELEMMNEELRLARERAEIHAEKWEELYDFAPSGYLTLSRDGTINQLNLSSAKMLGVERSVLIGRNFKSFIPVDSRPGLKDCINKIFEGSAKSSCELMLRTEDNHTLFVYIEGRIVENSDACSLTMIDITDRRIMEEILKKTMAALEKSNADLQQFAYIASHDLQEPLRMISSYIKLLENKLQNSLDEKTSEYMRFIVDGAKRMQTLIHDLLSYSRISTQKADFTSTDLNSVMKDVLKDLEFAITDSKAEIIVDKLPVIMANSTQMHQLFQNLIANAIKFREDEDPVVSITIERKGPGFTFRVKDNGIGISPEDSERIFAIFQRLHERDKFPGTGIGLALCRKIVENHGGRIWVESAPGKGSTFYFTIPADAKPKS